MAEEFVAATVIALLKNTIAAAADRFGLMPGFKDELIKMEGLVRDIQARVADAERKQSNNTTVLRWLKDFKGAILEAEMVLDELQYEGLRREVHGIKRGKVSSFFSLLKHDVSFRVRMSNRVRAINVKLKNVKDKAHDLELAMLEHDFLLLSRDSDVTVEEANRQTDSLPQQFVAGRRREESEIVDMLLLEKAASLVSTSPFNPFVLGKLPDKDCWLIIARRATQGGEMPEWFEVYKEEILKKCQGLPLAANVIGGLLSSPRKENWISIVEALKVREAVDGDIMPILKLSYDYLPYPHIKKCFVYCSVYSKNARMEGQDLIELWMAQGYLQDDIKDGASCLITLVQSSLLAFSYGYYQMHDLVQDLAESISEGEQFDEYKHLQCRHLGLGEEELEENWNTKSKLVQIVKGGISDEMLLEYIDMCACCIFSVQSKQPCQELLAS